jgi:HlyD family secretion protein
VESVNATETLGANGIVRGERVVDLGLGIVGTIERIFAKEGDSVRAGALILSADTSEANAVIDAARAGLQSAQAELARASRPPLGSEVGQARAEIAQADAVGRAKVIEAQSHLRDLIAGSRHQEIAQAQAELASGKALLTKAQTDLQRMQRLVSVGAIARSQYDAAVADAATQRAAVAAQQAKLSLARAGTRPEVIAGARASLVEAQASWATGVRAAQERLRTVLAQPRSEDVWAARAKADQAQAELRRAAADGSKTALRAPFDGIVSAIVVEQGQSISPLAEAGVIPGDSQANH